MYPVEHIWTILMLKILHAHLLRTFVANSKIDAIYVLYPESFCDKNLAVRKVFAFSDSVLMLHCRILLLNQCAQWFISHWIGDGYLIRTFWIGYGYLSWKFPFIGFHINVSLLSTLKRRCLKRKSYLIRIFGIYTSSFWCIFRFSHNSSFHSPFRRN